MLYHHMSTHTGFLNKFECTASFQLSAEVQTPSAEQAQVQAAGREKYIYFQKNDANIMFENISNLFQPWKLAIA